MSKPRIFIYMHYLEIGGAERALIGLLNALDPEKVEVDVFLNQHTGELLPLVPEHVRLLPELPEYSAIERPIKDIVKEGHLSIALRRLLGKFKHKWHLKRIESQRQIKEDYSIFFYAMREVLPELRPLDYLGEYDLAISFLQPHNIVLDKVKARHKVCWIHTDYSTVYVNEQLELPVWAAYDHIAAISGDAAVAFAAKFPTLRDKLITVENILSPVTVVQQADLFDVHDEMPPIDGETRILSIGRFCLQKRFDDVPRMCRRLLDRGLRFKWYIVGFGDDSVIRQNIVRYGVEDTLILLGKKSNPYPYIKACDVYAQPSLYEGKSVTVREAQILCRPVVISAYPTASSQVSDGIDGRIVPLDIDECADGIFDFVNDAATLSSIVDHLRANDYGNESEVEKIYRLLC